MSRSASCLAIQPNLAQVSVHKRPKLPGSGTSFPAVPLRNARETVNGILVHGPSHSQQVGQTCLSTGCIIFGGRTMPLHSAYKRPKLPQFLRFGFSVFFKFRGDPGTKNLQSLVNLQCVCFLISGAIYVHAVASVRCVYKVHLIHSIAYAVREQDTPHGGF